MIASTDFNHDPLTHNQLKGANKAAEAYVRRFTA